MLECSEKMAMAFIIEFYIVLYSIWIKQTKAKYLTRILQKNN